jgi:hypothetical protein
MSAEARGWTRDGQYFVFDSTAQSMSPFIAGYGVAPAEITVVVEARSADEDWYVLHIEKEPEERSAGLKKIYDGYPGKAELDRFLALHPLATADASPPKGAEATISVLPSEARDGLSYECTREQRGEKAGSGMESCIQSVALLLTIDRKVVSSEDLTNTGSEGEVTPFWSPDGKYLAWFVTHDDTTEAGRHSAEVILKSLQPTQKR